jgi:hypothetical protein
MFKSKTNEFTDGDYFKTFPIVHDLNSKNEKGLQKSIAKFSRSVICSFKSWGKDMAPDDNFRVNVKHEHFQQNNNKKSPRLYDSEC